MLDDGRIDERDNRVVEEAGARVVAAGALIGPERRNDRV